MHNAQPQVGIVIRLPAGHPGLIQIDEQQLAFRTGPAWTSLQPPAINQRVRITFDEAGAVASLTPVESRGVFEGLQGLVTPLLTDCKAWLARQRDAGRLPWLLGVPLMLLGLWLFVGTS